MRDGLLDLNSRMQLGHNATSQHAESHTPVVGCLLPKIYRGKQADTTCNMYSAVFAKIFSLQYGMGKWHSVY